MTCSLRLHPSARKRHELAKFVPNAAFDLGCFVEKKRHKLHECVRSQEDTLSWGSLPAQAAPLGLIWLRRATRLPPPRAAAAAASSSD